MTPMGTLMWTASSAGWFVLWYVTSVPAAGWTSLGCGLMAAAWHWIQGATSSSEETEGQ